MGWKIREAPNLNEIAQTRAPASAPTWAAGTSEAGRAAQTLTRWPRAGPYPAPATNGRIRPQPYGGAGFAHLSWERPTHSRSISATTPNAGTRSPRTALPRQLQRRLHRKRNLHLEVILSRRSAGRRAPARRLAQCPALSQQARPPSGGKSSFPSFRLLASERDADGHPLSPIKWQSVAGSQW